MKYTSPYLLAISLPYLQNHIRMSLGRPQDASRTLLLESNIGPYENVLITSAGDVINILIEDSPWRYI